MALIGAQAWHALTGWVIFRVATETLGDQGYGAFVSVLWTMTTLEVLVTEGAPRAMSLGIALQPQATRTTLRRAWPATFGLAVVLCALLALAAPWLSASWQALELSTALRLSGLDFLTFAAFAVFASLANGLRDFAAQARVQVAYSTAKVLIVIAALLHFRSVEGAMLGYVVASGVGSLAAWMFTRRLAANAALQDPSLTTHSAANFRHAWPLGLQSLLLAILINVDLWAGATIAGAEDARFGLYGMAATLCHSVYFILRALGEALLPTIAHARGQQDVGAMRRATEDGLGLLLLLLAVATGLGLATAESLMPVLFGGAHHAHAAEFVLWLLPTAAAFTLLSVLAALLSGAGRPMAACLLLGLVTLADVAACLWVARTGTLNEVAFTALLVGLAAVFVGAVAVKRTLGAFISPRLAALALAAGSLNWALMHTLAVEGWLVIPVAGVVGLISVGGVMWRTRRNHATHS
jgi:O-antigen/teichoic acid export membrane protein